MLKKNASPKDDGFPLSLCLKEKNKKKIQVLKMMIFNENARNKDKAIMQYFPLLALIKKKVGNTKEEKHDKDMSIET